MICKQNLAPQGVAYVSYNTYPGGHLRQMTREMMLYHLRNLADPQERLGQARGFIKSLSESQGQAETYKIFLDHEVERVLNRPDEALYHDDLAEINTPFYFYQFMEQAARHQLKYLTEARLADSQTSVSPASLHEAGNPLGDDIVAKEQYFDFLRCRMFRQTLLCHDGVEIDRSPRLERMRKCYVASSARPVSTRPDIHAPGVIEQFRLSSGPVISIDHPLAKAALSHLAELWPQSMALDRLISQARELVGHDRSHDGSLMDQETSALCRVLLTIYEAELLELHTHQARMATVVSERPTVSPLARLQARGGTVVTTLRHTTVEVRDDLGRHLLTLLDGTRDREMLHKELTLLAQSGRVTAQPAVNVSLDDLELKLRELARLALLVA
jgi:methyltransferase-like protein